jgi:hypothetical protein
MFPLTLMTAGKLSNEYEQRTNTGITRHSPHQSSPYVNWMAAFPFRPFLELGAYDMAPGSARGHLPSLLAEWQFGPLAEAVLLVLGELITNSLVATSEAAVGGGAVAGAAVGPWRNAGNDAARLGRPSCGGEVHHDVRDLALGRIRR